MKWIAIAGTWQHTSPQVEADVRKSVKEIMERGDGIVSGGAFGVDYFGADEALRLNPSAEKIKIVIPATLERLLSHYEKNVEGEAITRGQYEANCTLLRNIAKAHPSSIYEHPEDTTIDIPTYYSRITKIVELADELVAFQVNKSPGTQDTIDKAHKKGIPVTVFEYKM